MNTTNRPPRFGEVYLVSFEGEDSVQAGSRPAVVFQNNVGNAHSPNVTVLPLTSKIKKASMPTHVFLPSQSTGLLRDSVVLCENPVCISKNRLGPLLTTLPEEYIGMVAEASLYASGAIACLPPEKLTSIRSRAARLNAVG